MVSYNANIVFNPTTLIFKKYINANFKINQIALETSFFCKISEKLLFSIFEEKFKNKEVRAFCRYGVAKNCSKTVFWR